MEVIKLVIADDVSETRMNIKKLLSFAQNIEVIGEASNGEEAINLVKESKPDVILMDINMPVKDGIRATEEITVIAPDTNVIMISVQSEQEYLKKAMAAGARDFIVKPFQGDELIETVQRVYEISRKRKESKFTQAMPEEIHSKVFSVFSTKGGVGKTTIATNLAVSLARMTRKKVALVDLDLQFGDVAVMLNVSLRSTISDLIKEFNLLDESNIEDYMVTHFSGIKVLSAPSKPEYAEYITPEHIKRIVECLKSKFHYVVIDTSNIFNEVVLTSLDLSDQILYVSTLDLPTIKNIKSGLDIMDTLHYSNSKINIVLNKASEQFGIKYKDFEDTMKHSIWSYIPEDSQTVITSANKGFPFVITRAETKVAKSIMAMAKELSQEKLEQEVKDKLDFKKLFGCF
ncbi:MAG: response regulator [Deltaproteobacteria bacterium]